MQGDSIVAFDEVRPDKEDEDIEFDRHQPQNRTLFLAFVCESSRGIRPRERLLVQDDFQKRFIDCNFAVVLDESEFPEFVHEEIHPRPRGSNHFRERLLRYLLQHRLGLILLTVAGEE